jgi:NAD(P)-dependent dehydrogenase (short-subunit alcohol dehydrogenase family)
MSIHPPPANSVLITGASSGIGRDCALHMDRLGWQVFAGVRKRSDARALSRDASRRLVPLLLDVTKPAAIQQAVRLIQRATGEAGLSGLVNNAGIPYGGPVEFLDLDELRRAFDVNFLGVVAVTQAFIPLLRRGRGRIINISSISGLIASPFLSPYSTSKFALEALSDALRVELSPWKIRVAVIEPGAINTPIWDKAVELSQGIIDAVPAAGVELYGNVLGAFQASLAPHGISTQVVSRAIAHALTSRHPRTRYRLGLDGFAVGILRFLPDSVRDRFFRSRFPRWG